MSTARIDKSKVTAQGGVPELYIDGVKTAPLFYALSDCPFGRAYTAVSQKNIKNFAAAGINVVCIDTSLYKAWKRNGEVDISEILKELTAVNEANPDAKVIVRLHVNAPYWWMRKNKSELIVFEGMECVDSGDYEDRVLSRDGINEIKVSYASDKWIKDCSAVMKTFIEKVRSTAVGQNLIGVQPAYGSCGEWHYFSCRGAAVPDFSVPMQKFFREYLKKKYVTLDKFHEYYDEASFDEARLATGEQRTLLLNGNMRVPEKQMRAVDSLRCISLSAVRAISAFCKVVKEASRGEMLAGSFYGYYFSVGAEYGSMLEPQEIFSDDNVDFLAGPSAYMQNKYAGNANLLRHMPESMRINGKLFLNEMDQGFVSWLSIKGEKPYACESEAEYRAVLIRNVFECLLHGNGAWFYEHRLPIDDIYDKKGYWDTPERMNTIKDIYDAAQKLTERPFVKSTDVLVIFDTETIYYDKEWFSHFDTINALSKSGAGYDIIYLSDVKKVDINRYKCVVFVRCEAMTKGIEDYVKTVVKGGGRTIFFIKPAGLITDGKSTPHHADELIGAAYGEKFASVKEKDCTVVYSQDFVFDANIFREVFIKAGAHIYARSGEVIIADDGFVMIHQKHVKSTTLSLNGKTEEIVNSEVSSAVYDARSGERLI